jgi:hypothetical protein
VEKGGECLRGWRKKLRSRWQQGKRLNEGKARRDVRAKEIVS